MDKTIVPSTGVNEQALQLWASAIGIGGEVQKLIAACGDLNSMLTEAGVREIQNKELVQYLKKARHVAYCANDSLSALEYYKVTWEEREEHKDDEDKLVHGIANQNLLSSTPGRDFQFFNDHTAEAAEDTTENSAISTEDLSSAALQIVPYVASPMTTVGNTSLVPRLEVLEKHNVSHEISEDIEACEISEHIEACHKMTDYVRRALQLEVLDYRMTEIYQSTKTDPRETTDCPTEPKVYGRDEERAGIISKLTSVQSPGQNISVLAIVGNGGVGKTTLAKVVFNDPAVSKHFNIRLWVYVSVHFNQVNITRELLESLRGDRHEDITDLKDLQKILGYELNLKRVLLVMDDMWEDRKGEKWNELLTPLLTNDVKGNKILVTTRKQSVATMTGATDVINLGALPEAEFWDLFVECAFGDENHQKHKKLLAIGKEIVVKLNGYPLAAKSVGKLLKRKLDDVHWRTILENSEWKDQKDDNDIMPALKISYNYLPKHLQQCFSYCAIFPKNHWYDKERLVNIWIAQGFIPSTNQHTGAEETGLTYLSDLIDWGFFLNEPPRISLLMHDLIHDLAQIVSSHECFTIEDDEPGFASELVRHVSVITESAYYGQQDGTVQPNEYFMQEFAKTFRTLPKKNLSSLMLFGAHDVSFAGTIKHELNEGKAIRVLKMEMVYPDLNILMSNISAFINLRYLELRSFYKAHKLLLPEAICKLYHLQVLDIIHNWGAKTVLPRGFNKLVNLRHLVAREELHARIAGVGKLVSLQELKAFKVKRESEFSIAQLGELNQLRGSISIKNLQNLESREEAIKARLRAKLHLTGLCLSWVDMPKTLGSLNIVEDLEPPTGIEILQINGYNGSAPSWLSSNFYLTSLRSLHLEKCRYWCTLPPLQQLPLLRELHLINMSHIDKIPIGRLKVLELRNMPRLRRFIQFETDQSYENLQVLELEGCHHLRDLPFQMCSSGTLTEHMFTRLQRVQIRDCHGYTSLPPLPLVDTSTDIDIWNACSDYKSFLLSLTAGSRLCLEIEGGKDSHVQRLDETLLRFSKLKDLQELEIRCFPCLKYLAWEGLEQMTSLKRFKMLDCANLFSNNPKLFLPTSVEELEFGRCNITGKQLSNLMLNLRCLKIVNVHYCDEITSLEVGMFVDEHNPMEEGLWNIPPRCLVTMEKLEISFSSMLFCSKKGLGVFNSLKEIDTRNCPMLLSSMISEAASEVPNCSLLPSSLLRLYIADMVDRLLPCSKLFSLVELHIRRSPVLTSVDLHSCTGLQKLRIEQCDMLQTIQGLQSLAFLSELKVVDCSKLASVQLQSCTSLQLLSIESCNALRTLDGDHSLTALKEVRICTNACLASVDFNSCRALEKLCVTKCLALESWQGFRSLTGLKSLQVSKSPGFVPSWLSAAEQILIEGNKFSIPLTDLDTDDIDVLSTPICSQLTSLETLSIRGVLYTPADKVDILMENHEDALLLLTSLKELTLFHFEHLKSLPSKLHRLTSLHRLTISYCPGINSLPLHRLTSLHRLTITYCPSITSLPEEGLPPSLVEMDLYLCSSELTELCRSMSKDHQFRLYIGDMEA